MVESIDTVTVRAERRALPSLTRMRRWIEKAVAPTMHALAQVARCPVRDVLAEFIERAPVSELALAAACGRTATLEYAEGRGIRRVFGAVA